MVEVPYRLTLWNWSDLNTIALDHRRERCQEIAAQTSRHSSSVPSTSWPDSLGQSNLSSLSSAQLAVEAPMQLWCVRLTPDECLSSSMWVFVLCSGRTFSFGLSSTTPLSLTLPVTVGVLTSHISTPRHPLCLISLFVFCFCRIICPRQSSRWRSCCTDQLCTGASANTNHCHRSGWPDHHPSN